MPCSLACWRSCFFLDGLFDVGIALGALGSLDLSVWLGVVLPCLLAVSLFLDGLLDVGVAVDGLLFGLLVGAVAAPAKVILFGSHARTDADDGSGFDFLVIEAEVDDGFAETARLNTLLGHLLIPPEVVIVSARQVEKTGVVKGTLIHQALSQGRVLAES
jgi:predicted nucleotidyltransferase